MQRVSYKVPIKSRPPSYNIKTKKIRVVWACTSTYIPACIPAYITTCIVACITVNMPAFMRSGLLIRDVQCHGVKRIFFDAGNLGS